VLLSLRERIEVRALREIPGFLGSCEMASNETKMRRMAGR
jgi:hypothetical protein